MGVYKRQVTGASPYFYELTDHLGNVRAVVSKETNETVAIKGATDYYPFGMPMPNRNLKGDYRYAYQGQEVDPETGKEAFQLRLWDSRIGRWLTTDPARQHPSPYLGMGNNPISRIDPDGGEDWFYDLNGNLVYDENVHNQADVDRLYGSGDLLSGGVYKAATFRENGRLFLSNGSIESLIGGETEFWLDAVVINSEPRWLGTARQELGQTEILGSQHNPRILEYLHTTGSWWTTDETPWCSAFCNWVMIQSGIEGTNSAAALSWRNWQGSVTLDRPAVGAIAVKTRAGGGHVGFVAGINAGGQIVILGGNQNDSVNYSAFSANFTYHFPTGYTPDYSLPLLEVTNGTVSQQ